MRTQIPVVIAAESSELRAGLQALSESIPHIGPITHAHDGPTLAALLAHDAPTLCLVDVALAAAVAGTGRRMLVVLIDQQGEREAAQAAGAALVVVKGTPAAQLAALLDRLLQDEIVRARHSALGRPG